MNLNELAVEISKLEAGKKNLSIAQIKEVVKCLSSIMFKNDIELLEGPLPPTKTLFWKLMLNGAKQINKKKKTR
jgi:hypothetical protein